MPRSVSSAFSACVEINKLFFIRWKTCSVMKCLSSVWRVTCDCLVCRKEIDSFAETHFTFYYSSLYPLHRPYFIFSLHFGSDNKFMWKANKKKEPIRFYDLQIRKFLSFFFTFSFLQLSLTHKYIKKTSESFPRRNFYGKNCGSTWHKLINKKNSIRISS